MVDNFAAGSGLYSHDYYGSDVSNHFFIYPYSRLIFNILTMPSNLCYSMIEVHILHITEMIGHTEVVIIKLKFLWRLLSLQLKNFGNSNAYELHLSILILVPFLLLISQRL